MEVRETMLSTLTFLLAHLILLAAWALANYTLNR
jgi:hypothetical protein